MKLQDLIYALNKLGLSEYESKVYITLVQLGVCGIKEIAAHSKVPRTKIYPVLKSLEKRGLVTIIPGKPRKAKALTPSNSLFEQIKELEENLNIMKNAVIELQKIYESLSKKDKFEEQKYWIIKGNDEIIKRINEIIISASEYVYFVLNNDGLDIILNKCYNAIDNISKSGINVKIFTNSNSLMINKLSELVEVKYVSNISDNNFILVDGKDFIIFNKNMKQFIAEHLNDPHICNIINQVLNQIDKQAIDFSISLLIQQLPNFKKSFIDEHRNFILPIFFYVLMETISKKGENIFNFLAELGKKIINKIEPFPILPNIQETLDLLGYLYLIDEGIEAKFTWDEKYLLCDYSGNLPESYRMAYEYGLSISPSIWSICLLGLMNIFGYSLVREEEEFNSNHWHIKYKLIGKSVSHIPTAMTDILPALKNTL